MRVRVGGAWLLVSVAIASYLAGLGGGGVTRLVSTTGADTGNCTSTPCATVNYAYSQAQPGDTVQLAAGSYGPQTIAYRSGMGASRVTIKPASGAAVSMTDVQVKASYLNVTGPLTFRTLNIGDDTGTQRITNVTVDNFTVDHQDSNVVSRNAMQAWASDNIVIKNGDVGNTMAGANVGEESNLLQFSGQPTLYNTQWTVDHVRFHDNDSPASSGAHNECVYALHVVGLAITNSSFESCTYYGIFLTDFLNAAPGLKDVLIENNTFSTGRNTSGADFGFSIDIHDNVAPDNFKFRYNTIENAVALSYAGALTNGFEITGNIVAMGFYVRFDGAFGCKSGPTFTNNVTPNTCGTNTTTATEAAIRAMWTAPSSTWGVADNFHLTSTAAALGAGGSSGFPTLDKDGVARVSPADAGAYEGPPPGSAAPVNTSAPTISGSATENVTLIGDIGTWTGSPAPSYAYQWRRCNTAGSSCVDISGATSSSYVLASADVGNTVRLQVTATNSLGNATATSTQTGTVAAAPASGNANLWVNTTAGGSPQPCPTACAYDANKAYGSIQAAWTAASSGQVIRVRGGTYGPQTVNGNKTSQTQILADAGVTLGTTSVSGNFAYLKDFVIDSGANANQGLDSDGSDVTYENVQVKGTHAHVGIAGNRVLWNGGRLGPRTGQYNTCVRTDPEPVIIHSGSDITIQHVTFDPILVDLAANANCTHLENVRIEGADPGGVHDVKLLFNKFSPGSQDNTSRVLITTSAPGFQEPYNITMAGNFFGKTDASYQIDWHSNVTNCVGQVIAYNTFDGWDQNVQCNSGSMVWVGNLGGKAGGACWGTMSKNVWTSTFNNVCGTDAWVSGGTNYTSGTGAGTVSNTLKFDATTGNLLTGSGAINGGENSYCSSLLGNKDINGATRSGFCDAGSDEF